MRNSTKKLIMVASLLALSLIFSYIEFLLPPILPHPAFRLGLSQIPVLIAFYLYDLKSAAFISIVKVLLVSIILGYFFSFLFFVNVTGSVGSILFIGVASRIKLSIYTLSVFSSLGHNIGQFAAISLFLGLKVALFYLPAIIIFSVLFGFATGGIAKISLEKLKERFI